MRKAEEVQCQSGLRHLSVPQVQWKIWVAAANTCDQIVLERLDGPFSSVGSMQLGRGELEGDSLFSHEGLESCGVFIVESLENGSQALVGELGVKGSVGSDKFMFAAGLQWFWEYDIAVIIVQDHDVLAAPT